MAKSKASWAQLAFPLSIAAVLLWFFAGSSLSHPGFRFDAVRCDAVVSRVNSGYAQGRWFYSPMVRFDADGRPFELPLDEANDDPNRWTVGDIVRVVFPAGKPDEVALDTFWAKWAGLLLSLVCILPAMALFTWFAWALKTGRLKTFE